MLLTVKINSKILKLEMNIILADKLIFLFLKREIYNFKKSFVRRIDPLCKVKSPLPLLQ